MSHHTPPQGYPSRQQSYQPGQPPLQTAPSYGAPPPPPQYYQQPAPQPYGAPIPPYQAPPPAPQPYTHQPPAYSQALPPHYSQPPPSGYQAPVYSAPLPQPYSQGLSAQPPQNYSAYPGMYSNGPPPPQQGAPPPPPQPGGYSGGSGYQPVPTSQPSYQQPPQYHNTPQYNYNPPGPAQYVSQPSSYGPNYGNGQPLLHSNSSNGYSAATAPPSTSSLTLDSTGLPTIPGDNVQSPCKLKISEKVWDATRDSFTITDHRKRPLYNVDGSRTTDQYKVLKNASGQALLQMRQRSSLKTKMLISDMQGNPLLTLIRARTDGKDHKRIDGYLGTDASSPSVLLVVGNGACTSFKIENGHQVVIADVARPARTLKRVFTGQDDYSVEVATGCPALITMIVVAIDEMYCDEGS